MKSKNFVGVSSALCLGMLPLAAQETTDIDQLKKELEATRQQLEQSTQAQRDRIEALEKRIHELDEDDHPADEHSSDSHAEHHLHDGHTHGEETAGHFRFGADAHLDLGLVGTFAVGGSTADDLAGSLQPGGHDPNQNGFNVQGLDAILSGGVDDVFDSTSHLLFSMDAEGEFNFELEEAWMETTELPGGFRIRGGQIFTEFGRVNATHLHAWDFADSPLVNGRLLGPDGLRNPGAMITWKAPTPFETLFFVSLQNSGGEAMDGFRASGDHQHGGGEELLPYAYRHRENDRGLRHIEDILITPRLLLGWDIGERQHVDLGASAAFGPNNIGGEGSGDTRTRVYGVDLTWEWQLGDDEYPRSLRWQTEALWRETTVGAFDWDEDGNGLASSGELMDDATGLPALLDEETLSDYGFYTQLVYQFHPAWSTGLRYDWLERKQGDYERRPLSLDGQPVGDDIQRGARWRLSPNVTWRPAEFAKLRLQYNYDDRRSLGIDHSAWLQFEFSLGNHPHHE